MAEKADVKSVVSELVRRINEDSRRIRASEQRIERMETSFSTLEERLLTQLGDLKISLERIGSKISDVSDKIIGMETDISRINKELGKTASKSELKQIETYLEIINPITSKFVTKDELERMLEGKFARKAQV